MEINLKQSLYNSEGDNYKPAIDAKNKGSYMPPSAPHDGSPTSVTSVPYRPKSPADNSKKNQLVPNFTSANSPSSLKISKGTPHGLIPSGDAGAPLLAEQFSKVGVPTFDVHDAFQADLQQTHRKINEEAAKKGLPLPYDDAGYTPPPLSMGSSGAQKKHPSQ